MRGRMYSHLSQATTERVLSPEDEVPADKRFKAEGWRHFPFNAWAEGFLLLQRAWDRATHDVPGVGHKTASVVMAQAFGVPAFPVDTHIHRLAKRWRLSSGKNVAQTERDLKRLFPESHWNQLHLRIIFYGREHCTARGCDGHTCGICHALSPRK